MSVQSLVVYALRTDGEFLTRIDVMFAKVATEILTEPALTDNHAERLDLARKILANPQGGRDLVAWVVLSAEKVAAGAEDHVKNILDDDIKQAIASAIDGLVVPNNPKASKALDTLTVKA